MRRRMFTPKMTVCRKKRKRVHKVVLRRTWHKNVNISAVPCCALCFVLCTIVDMMLITLKQRLFRLGLLCVLKKTL